MKSVEELKLEVLELQEKLKVESENNAKHVERVKELERLNTTLFNKVAVSFEKAERELVEEDTTASVEEFTKTLLGGK